MENYINPPPEDADPWLVMETRFQNLIGDPFWFQAVDCLVTSLPYNVGMNYKGGLSDSLKTPEYVEFGRTVAALMDWVLAPGASAWINLCPGRKDPGACLQMISGGLLDPKYQFRMDNWITWLKSGTTPRTKISSRVGPANQQEWISWGHFNPSSHRHLLHKTWEWVLHLRREKDPAPDLDKLAIGCEYVDPKNVDRFGEQGRPNLRCRGNLWAVPYETKKNKVMDRHPAQFPPELVEHCLALSRLPMLALVLDPCSGVQNTGVACARRGLRYAGCEISPDYCAQGREILKEAYRK